MLDYGDVWAEINLDNLKHNLDEIKKKISPGTAVMAVVKAGAYGHGLSEVAGYLSRKGVSCFGVASVSEGIELVKSGITLPIVVLRSVQPEQMEKLLEYGLIPSINCVSLAEEANMYGKRNGKKVKIHVRVDTGGEGDGIPYSESLLFFKELSKMKWIYVEGIYTHLVSAYGDDTEAFSYQLDNFRTVLGEISKSDIHIPIVHAASSPAIFDHPEAHFNMVRAGTALYGLPFSKSCRTLGLKPVMRLKSRVVCIKELKDGYSLGYGIKHKIEKPLRLATVSIGYADARFLLGAKGLKVLVGGEYAPVYGNAHMDHIKVDITSIKNVNIGDEVVVFGSSGGKTVYAADAAEASGISVLNCESVCFLGERTSFVFLENNKITKVRGAYQLPEFYDAG